MIDVVPPAVPARFDRVLAAFVAPRGRRAVVAWFCATVIITLWIWHKAIFTSPMGEGDWSDNFMMSDFLRKAYLDLGEIPGWSRRYVRGWAPHLQTYTALPETPLLSPLLPVLLFVPNPWSFKAFIAIHLLLGIAGLFALTRRLGLRPIAGCVSSLAVFSSGHLTAHVSLGHCSWMTIAYIPWAAAFALRAFQGSGRFGIPQSPRTLGWLGATALALALIVIAGASHISIYATFLVGALVLGVGLRERRITAALVFNIFIAVGVVLFGAARLIPTMAEYGNYVSPHRDPAYHFSPVELVNNFFVTVPEGGWPWERAVYMGALLFALAAAGAILRWRKPVVVGLIVTLALGHALAALPAWDFLFKLPVFKTQGVHARFILLSIFAIALLAGFALSALLTAGLKRHRVRLAGGLAIACIVGVSVDLRANTEWWFKNYRKPYVDVPVVLDAPHVVAPPTRPARVTAKSTRVFQVDVAPGPAAPLVFPELGHETEAARWETAGAATIRVGVRPLTVDVGDNVTAFTLAVVPTKFFQGVAISLSSVGAWIIALFVWRRWRRSTPSATEAPAESPQSPV